MAKIKGTNILGKAEIRVLSAVYWLAYETGSTRRDELAKRIGLERSTIQTHLDHIYSKLGVHDLASAIIKAKDILELI
jgi:ATP/maltotriose-dependent transcriptional regulator MalT